MSESTSSKWILNTLSRREMTWLTIVASTTAFISYFHINTSPSDYQTHLILMQAYFVPVLIGAFQFGVVGGLGTAIVVSSIFTPHIMFQWVGDFEHNVMVILQILLFNVVGYLTGSKVEKERQEKLRYREAARALKLSLKRLEEQASQLSDLEEQLRLSDRLAIIGELTASLAHELRNPLGTIRGTVEILQDELPAESRQSEFFQILIQETERMSAVVENYLSFARQQKSSSTRYQIQQVVQNTVLILGSRARKEQIRIQVDLPAEPLFLSGNPNDLRQILVNLILNAIEAMKQPGRIEIKGVLEDSGERVAQPGQDRSPLLLLRISDQGEGMPEEVLANIFTPFYTTKSSGTGLGLSIVKRIVDQLHWKISVRSTLRRGTTFELLIPPGDPPKSVVEKHMDHLNPSSGE